MRNLYEILGVSEDATPEELKRAYHRALLEHHPDKKQPGENDRTPQKSVHDIKRAFVTLTDPTKRNDYTERLHSTTRVQDRGEVVDLSEMSCNESDQSLRWTWPCRCGQKEGYVVTEQDLEDNLDLEEVAVQCLGCSLWITVEYQEG
jgi:diphthamide biosynthesis protein 4